MSNPFENEDSIKLLRMRDPEPTTEQDPRMHLKLEELHHLGRRPARLNGMVMVHGPKLAGPTYVHDK